MNTLYPDELNMQREWFASGCVVEFVRQESFSTFDMSGFLLFSPDRIPNSFADISSARWHVHIETMENKNPRVAPEVHDVDLAGGLGDGPVAIETALEVMMLFKCVYRKHRYRGIVGPLRACCKVVVILEGLC